MQTIYTCKAHHVCLCVCLSAIGAKTITPIELKFCIEIPDYPRSVIGYVGSHSNPRLASWVKSEGPKCFWSHGDAFLRKVY